MDSFQQAAALVDAQPTSSQEALGLIVEVFRDGYRAAADLRRSALGLTPRELQMELTAIEETMLSKISSICENYQLQELGAPRH